MPFIIICAANIDIVFTQVPPEVLLARQRSQIGILSVHALISPTRHFFDDGRLKSQLSFGEMLGQLLSLPWTDRCISLKINLIAWRGAE